MSGINDKATVDLFVNGEQASSAMKRLSAEAAKLKQNLDNAIASGDTKGAAKLQKSLDKVNKELNRTESAAKGAGIVLNNLSTTSITGLNNTLKHLQRQLNSTTPNTPEWKAYAAQINEVKARISDLQQEMQGGESAWGKFKDWAQNSLPALYIVKNTFQSITSTVRGFVDSYAEVEQEMANVRKFTGMSADDVKGLNEELAKMDTRTSVVELNKLAEEAGRLGLTSQEDVLGFVRAADIINVALDDLGEGATLTLSKITDIFGDREAYGVEQSLLKVGSVINELSQSSSASAPYIAQFAQRLSGVGVQAGMSVSQIMALGAVLDSSAQPLEAASTAISQVIVRMMQDPAKYAQVAGLEVEKFTQLLKTDTNEALLVFLETLNNAGGMDVLAPMFKDMGENGSRAIQTLTSLASSIDVVRQRQREAADAFAEGASVTAEANIQNNTVQASLEKAEKRMQALRVELGEKLAPMMSYAASTTEFFASVVSTLVGFVVSLRGVLIPLAVAIASYYAYVGIAKTLTAAWNLVVGAGSMIMKTYRATIALTNITVIAFTKGLGAAKLAFQALNTTMKANPIGLVASAVTLLIVGVTKLVGLFKEEEKVEQKVNDEHEKYVKSLTDINQASASYCAEEHSRLDLLYNAATNENLAREARIKAVKDLQKLYPDYFGNLSVEAIMAGQAKTQYDDLTKSILAAAKARAAAELIQKNSGSLINLEMAGDDLKTKLDAAKNIYASLQAGYRAFLTGNLDPSAPGYGDNNMRWLNRLGLAQKEVERIQLLYDANIQAQDEIKQANETLANRYGLTGTNTPTIIPNPPGTTDPTTTPTTDRFAEEKAKRKELEDLARIDYQTGIDNYQQYTERMAAIAVDYYSGLLERQDLSEQERLTAEADYAEASRKLSTAQYATDVATEEADYADLLDRLRRNHAARINQEGITAEELRREDDYYSEVTELAELNHLRNMRDIYAQGSAEWLAADRKYQDKQIEAQERHRRKMADIVAKAESEYASIKDKYFGDSQQEREQKYQHALDVLNQVYQRELIAAGDNANEKLRIEEAYLKALAALRQQYGVEDGAEDGAEGSAGGFKEAINKSAKWLESDGGKALTRGLSTAVSSMSSIFSGLTSLIQAETELQTAAVERRYDKEIESAQGSSYKVAALEKKKEQEIAAIKNAASRKQYSMQVVQAIAQTAQNALAAYGSAAAIPLIGHILAPIAAAAAVAAGMIQVQAIKKQQQAAEAQGYASGGFTRPGAVNEPAGIVHAGEWVASQRLLANPVARPMIDALDYAQRTNTIGSLRADDVSRSITATNTIARVTETDEGAILMAAVASKVNDTVAKLTKRLNEPFVTINTVTGDHGIKQAQDNYNRLLNNITPKSKR